MAVPSSEMPLRGKQRELYERDERVLTLAQRVFMDEGYHAVTIENIARELGFARGTLYQRFSCKEILILELAIRCRQQVTDLMGFASRIPGRPRERMVAIGEAFERYGRLYADNLRTMALLDSAIILEKVPPEQAQRAEDSERAVYGILLEIVREAVTVGDLVLPAGVTAGSICLALLVMIYGWAEVYRRPARFKQLGVENPAGDILASAHRLLDGYGWQPLHDGWDYDAVYRRVGEALAAWPALEIGDGNPAMA